MPGTIGGLRPTRLVLDALTGWAKGVLISDVVGRGWTRRRPGGAAPTKGSPVPAAHWLTNAHNGWTVSSLLVASHRTVADTSVRAVLVRLSARRAVRAKRWVGRPRFSFPRSHASEHGQSMSATPAAAKRVRPAGQPCQVIERRSN
jgi:hypothetical protein